jgi:RecB family exonuclease
MLASDRSALGLFAAIADRPGWPRALTSTLIELMHADLAPDALAREAPDLAMMYAAYRAELPAHGLIDRASVLEQVIALIQNGEHDRALDRPLLLLDLRIRSPLEADLVTAIAARTPHVLATIPRGDDRTHRLLCERLDFSVEAPPPITIDRAVHAAQSRIFEGTSERVEDTARVEIFSAPGENRECVEIARRVLQEARNGTRFDRMAVLLRAPAIYGPHIVEAFRRAGIPTHLMREAQRPDPAGRALLALLDCAAEGLSARGFGEYLSLGVVPDAVLGEPPHAKTSRERFVPADDELSFGAEEDEGESVDLAPANDDYDEEAPVRAGTLRAPRRWEQLIVDAAVIGGRDRWARRLDGAIATAKRAKDELEDPDDPQAHSLARRLADLAALRAFALPLVGELAALPKQAAWGIWLEALTSIASRSLRDPRRVLSVLASFAPMADVGPVDLAEVRIVLGPRLREEPPNQEEIDLGRVMVGTIDEARGREFDVVFVPGLAEKIFPAKIVEDPILLDESRRKISPLLATRSEHGAEERLLLRIALGAASERIVVSIPRIDATRARSRVASFYALEIARAVEGTLPSFEDLGRRAELRGAARLNWPAPEKPELAIDAAEHDLSVLGRLHSLAPKDRAGRASYLGVASPTAVRALRMRYARWDRKRWRPQDGMVEADESVRAVLADHTMDRRAFSATALESFAQCPYKFYLRTIVRLEPREIPEPLEQLDPAQRGTIVHQVQFRLLTRLREKSALPLTPDTLPSALELLDEIVAEVAREAEEELAPAILRVFEDAVESLRRDARRWLEHTALDPSWVPRRFELAFGIPSEERDEASLPTPVPLSIGMTLRGAIDLVEEREGELRATDHKTGSAWIKPGQRLLGGEKLQPILYALALESLFPTERVWGGRLFYCTEKGRFAEALVPLDVDSRALIRKAIGVIDESIRTGFLPPAPTEKACSFCDYVSVCGPHERRRSQRKEGDRLVKLDSLRRLP